MLVLSSTTEFQVAQFMLDGGVEDTMKPWCCAVLIALFALIAFSRPILAQQSASQSLPQEDSSYTNQEGTVYVTRIVPVPQTVSPEAQKSLVPQVPSAPSSEVSSQKPQPVQTRQMSSDATRAIYPANIEFSTLAGVPVSVVTPLAIPANKTNRVLINLHGGGFHSDSGSLTESLPIANLTQTKVVAVIFRLSPEYPFPAPVEDVVAVYKGLLKVYEPRNIAIYG